MEGVGLPDHLTHNTAVLYHAHTSTRINNTGENVVRCVLLKDLHYRRTEAARQPASPEGLIYTLSFEVSLSVSSSSS